jgi:hypothetical protein
MTDPVTVAGAIIGTGASMALYSKWQRDQMMKSDVWGWLCGAEPLCGFKESQAVTIMVEFMKPENRITSRRNLIDLSKGDPSWLTAADKDTAGLLRTLPVGVRGRLKDAISKARSEEGSKDSIKTNVRVFLGYREVSDAHIVQRLYDLLIEKGVDVWYDKVSLPCRNSNWVTEWKEGFANGMYSSDIFVPILSKAALEPFAKLTAESSDNVLLEHQLALELLESEDLRRIYPVLVGEAHEVVKITTHTDTHTNENVLDEIVSKTAIALEEVEGVIGKHFQEDNFLYKDDFVKPDGVPACVVTDVERKLAENLKRLDGKFSSLHRTARTVKDSLDTILDFQGAKLVGTHEQALQFVAYKIENLSRQYSREYLAARDLDRKNLIAKLEAAAASNRKAAAASIRLDGVLDTDKYVARLLEYGDVQAATLGLENFMGVDQKWLYGQCSAGVDAMKREVKDRSQVEKKRA